MQKDKESEGLHEWEWTIPSSLTVKRAEKRGCEEIAF